MNLTSAAFKLFYWPVCRAYARYLGDRPADKLLRFLCGFQFWRVHRFWPNFSCPGRFSEKVWSRFLHNRDPLFTLISDKLAVRDYVSKRIGNEYLVPLVWKGDSFDNIRFNELPLKFVIKTNHGCGYNILVKDKNKLDIAQVKMQLEKWLSENFCNDKYLGTEWGYRNIKPTIIIESFLDDNGKAPVDYKFYCFAGRVEVLTVHFDRFEEHKTRSFDRSFKPHQFRYDFPQWTGEVKRPKNFDMMIRLAELLAAEFDFIRVDLYSIGEKVYFSELTPYPGGVSTKFLPIKEDCVLGAKWISKRKIG